MAHAAQTSLVWAAEDELGVSGSDYRNRPSQITPVTGCNVLAYSCAAARDFHPLPETSSSDEAREPSFEKEQGNEL
jgi:hypothetical protein